MRLILKELNNPPPPPGESALSVKDFALYSEPSLRNNFLNNTMRLNNMHAFGSVHAGRVNFLQFFYFSLKFTYPYFCFN